MAVATWAANTGYSVGDIRVSVSFGSTGLSYRCTTDGVSGSTEPDWPKSIGGTVVDNEVTWTAISSVYDDLAGRDPFSVVELFEMELVQALHYSAWAANTAHALSPVVTRRATVNQTSGLVFQATTAGTTGSTEPTWPTVAGGTVSDGSVVWTAKKPIFYFHSGVSSNDYVDIKFAGNTYQALPMEADGFEYKGGGGGGLPRPTLKVSNAFGLFTSYLIDVNAVTAGNDLTGAKITRVRTLSRFLEYMNFGTDDFLSGSDETGLVMEDGVSMQLEEAIDPSDPDESQRFPDEVYFIDRKVIETRELCEFELCSVFDLAGVRIPKRQCLPSDFPGIGAFHS